MDPLRTRAYLQAAVAGLGFDIGEVWWTSNEKESSTVAEINSNNKTSNSSGIVDDVAVPRRFHRFLQLYTSKAYDDMRSNLLSPQCEELEKIYHNGEENNGNEHDPSSSSSVIDALNDKVLQESENEAEKHVLSPTLIDAISSTTQIVWANCEASEGLLGRSDVCFHTAIAMPVATDERGNMCIVVMFSEANVQSNEMAMEYLQFISKSASYTSRIPCLLPVVSKENALKDSTNVNNEVELQQHQRKHQKLPSDLNRKGIKAIFVSFKDNSELDGSFTSNSVSFSNLNFPFSRVSYLLQKSLHDLANAPKDTFGIPMLPTSAELGGTASKYNTIISPPVSDAFDEASYGVWSTVMENYNTQSSSSLPSLEAANNTLLPSKNSLELLADSIVDFNGNSLEASPSNSCKINMKEHEKVYEITGINDLTKNRLEEFTAAFLGMSVFELADVWVMGRSKQSQKADTLFHVSSVSNSENSTIEEFKRYSEGSRVGIWSGAVGRAFGSGNPVWSCNKEVIVDSNRVTAFESTDIRTVLAVPIFPSGSKGDPSCVVACYALVRMESVPHVLRFLQQALRLVWDGLDRVVPHESVGTERWRDVNPTDLGEMAADLEMQHAFLKKKRPYEGISAVCQIGPIAQNEQNKRNCISPTMNTPMIESTSFKSTVPNYNEIPRTVASPSVLIDHVQEAVRSFNQVTSSRSIQSNESDISPQHQIVHSVSNPSLIPAQAVMSSTPTKYFNPHPTPAAMSIAPVVQSIPFQQPKNLFTSGPKSIQLTHVNHSLNKPKSISNIHNQIENKEPPIQLCQEISFEAPINLSSVRTNTQICRIQGCSEPSVSRRPYCMKHSGNRLCEHAGCKKCAQGSTRFCIAHGGGRRCTFPGCDKGARDKYFCAAHGGGKRCINADCNKSAVGGSKYCTSHGGGKRCAVPGCDKSAQSSTLYCVKHGGGKKCLYVGCTKVARGKTLYCAAHGGGIRCKLEGCNRVAIGKMQLCRAHGGGNGTNRNTNLGNKTSNTDIFSSLETPI